MRKPVSQIIFFLFLIPCISISAIPDQVNTKPVVLILLGSPGSGRATLAIKMSNTFSLPYISFAETLFACAKHEDDIGRRARECLKSTSSIPNDFFKDLLIQRIANHDCDGGFLLDGFPVTVDQAKELNQVLKERYQILVVSITVSEEYLITRTETRSYCKKCGRVYDLKYSPPQRANKCDLCYEELGQRLDDTPQNIKTNQLAYNKGAEPILKYFSSEHQLTEIDGERTIEDLFEDLKRLMNQKIAYQ